jgi:hypothetical protein
MNEPVYKVVRVYPQTQDPVTKGASVIMKPGIKYTKGEWVRDNEAMFCFLDKTLAHAFLETTASAYPDMHLALWEADAENVRDIERILKGGVYPLIVRIFWRYRLDLAESWLPVNQTELRHKLTRVIPRGTVVATGICLRKLLRRSSYVYSNVLTNREVA